MCCKKCKHDFCWVCLDNWKCHNSSTGGYFECNRYDAQKKATALLDQRRDSYYGNAKELEAISRFLHYYERYKEHLNSLALEEPFLDKARDKMVLLAQSVQGMDGLSAENMNFIEDAVRELLKCRRVLQATYPFAYYLRLSHKRREFERLQGALEQVTEMLAEVVARPHLRKPRSEIIRLTHEARTKRTMLLEAKDRMTPQLPRLPVPDDTDSEPEDSDVTTFIRMLEGMRADWSHEPRARSHDRSPDWRTHERPSGWRSHDTRQWSHDRSHDQGREDDELLRALEISRQEFEADRQLKEDIEKAKVESIASPSEVTFDPQPDEDWIRRLDSNHEDTLSWPVLRLSTPPHSPPPTPPTPHTSHTDEWGPLVSEDDDLARALELSMQQSSGMMHIEGPQVIDSNKLEEGNMYGLPPELQHLLDTRRSGEHV